jgi:hypothetical protein
MLPALWRRTWFTALSTILALKIFQDPEDLCHKRDVISPYFT